MMKFNIPKELVDNFFYHQNEVVDIDLEKMDLLRPLFSYEIVYFHGLSKSDYWIDDKLINDIFFEWEILKNTISELHKKRSLPHQQMKQGIALFFMLLFWSNGKPVVTQSWKENVKTFKAKAVNIEERLSFVMKSPSLYHSFIQLSELMVEQHKQFAKIQLFNKRNV